MEFRQTDKPGKEEEGCDHNFIMVMFLLFYPALGPFATNHSWENNNRPSPISRLWWGEVVMFSIFSFFLSLLLVVPMLPFDLTGCGVKQSQLIVGAVYVSLVQ